MTMNYQNPEPSSMSSSCTGSDGVENASSMAHQQNYCKSRPVSAGSERSSSSWRGELNSSSNENDVSRRISVQEEEKRSPCPNSSLNSSMCKAHGRNGKVKTDPRLASAAAGAGKHMTDMCDENYENGTEKDVPEEQPPPPVLRIASATTTTGLCHEPIILVKSNSVSATRAENILRLDLNGHISTTSSRSSTFFPQSTELCTKSGGQRLSTGDSPLNMQRTRCGSHGPANLRTGFPSPAAPGTPSRSSFSGVPTFMNNKAYMVARVALNEANGKLLPLSSFPPSSDHHSYMNMQQDTSAITPGRLSMGVITTRAGHGPPSKWDDAEKWLVNASPSHTSQLPPHPSKPAATDAYNYHGDGRSKHCNNKIKVNRDVGKLADQLAMSKDSSACSSIDRHQSRSLIPLPSSTSSSSSSHLSVHMLATEEDLAASTAMSDSELDSATIQGDQDYRILLRSSSHKLKETDGIKHRSNVAKSQIPKKSVVKEELYVSVQAPCANSLRSDQRQPLRSHLHIEQFPKMHDVYTDKEVEATRNGGAAGPCRSTYNASSSSSSSSACGQLEAAAAAMVDAQHQAAPPAPNTLSRLVVHASQVVGRWGGSSGSMRDASTDVSPKQSMSRRDMGTQMTPVASSKTSRSATPRKSDSPVRHNTPTSAKSADSPGLAKSAFPNNKLPPGGHAGIDSSTSFSSTSQDTNSSWKSLQENVSSSSTLVKDLKVENSALAQYTTWEENERSKYMTKCAREEARIDAWEKHQKAKAEAELKKLEMKLERLRAQATEKIMNKMAATHLRAEEMRATIRAQQAEQLAKSLERANGISRKSGSRGICFSIMP